MYKDPQILQQLALHETLPGDEEGGCCHKKKPSPWPPIITCIILLIPRLMEAVPSFTSKRSVGEANPASQIPTSAVKELHINAIDVFRAIAIYRTATVHFRCSFPYDALKSIIYRFCCSDVQMCEYVYGRIQTSFEGIFSVVAVYLVLQCDSFVMFTKRLIRKVGRQSLVFFFRGMWMAFLLFASTPVNCIIDSGVAYLKLPSSMLRWIVALITMTEIWPNSGANETSHTTYNFAFEVDIKEVLLIGILGLLRHKKGFSFVPAATAVVYWAYLIKQEMSPDACNALMRTSAIFHENFWMHWFPTSLIWLLLDGPLRSEFGQHFMGYLKQSLGFGATISVFGFLCFSFWIGTEPMVKILNHGNVGFTPCQTDVMDWQKSDFRFVLCCLPFEIAMFLSLHFLMAPEPATAKIHRQSLSGKEQPAILGFFLLSIRNLSSLSLQIIAWHTLVYDTLRVHSPAWEILQKRPQNSLLGYFMLHFAPAALLTLIPAWFSYRFIEKPWAKIFYSFTNGCSALALHIFLVSYLLLCAVDHSFLLRAFFKHLFFLFEKRFC